MQYMNLTHKQFTPILIMWLLVVIGIIKEKYEQNKKEIISGK